jgi:hypothetical protein
MWRTAGRAGADGVARLRVPYATNSQLPARPLRPYRVTVGDAAHAVVVPEAAVTTGAVVRVGEAGP